MSVILADGSPVSEAMTVYRVGNAWFLPLSQLMEGLNVSISTSPSLGKAEGDFLEPGRHFSMDKSLCQSQANSIVENYDCSLVISHDDEIYIETKLLEHWFPLHFKIDSFASQILIESPVKFPKQARREREKLAASLAGTKSIGATEGYEFQPFPAKNLTTPMLDQQITTSYDQSKQTNFQQDTSASMEVLGFESKAFLGGSDRKVDQWSLNFSKKDPRGNLLGEMHAQEIQAFDLNLPTMPLISTSTRARGLLISSFSLSQPSNFTSKDFRGPLPSGWEIEIYQNDILVGRQVAGSSTEYEFKDLQLAYGINRFRLVFYGPQGQHREEVETINIGQNLNRPGEKNYRLAVGSPVDASGALSNENRTLLQYQQGLNSNWSVATSYLGIENRNLQESSVHYGLLGFYGSLSRLFAALNIATTDHSGFAVEQSLQAPFERGSIGASHANLSKFQSDLYNLNNNAPLKQIDKLNASWGLADLLSLRLTGEVTDLKFEDHQTTVIVQRTSWKAGPFLWFHTLTKDPDANPELTGQLSSIANFSGYEVRPTLDYSRQVDAIGGAIQRRLSDKASAELGVRDSYKDRKKDYNLTFNRLFRNFTVSAEASADSNGDYKVTGLFSYSATLDPALHQASFSSQPQTDYGALSAHVYLDMDQNGSFNEGDLPLEGIQILVNQNETHSFTDSNGHVLLTKLPAYEFVDLSISSKSLPDPFYKPAKKGFRILPRPGNVFEMEFPVVIQSEVDGLVQIGSGAKQRGKGKIEVQLRDATGKILSRSTSASDGFFVIENISQGQYELILSPEQLKDLGLKSRPTSHQILVPPSGLINSSFDFALEKD